MAQNFRRFTNNNVGITPVTSFTANSYDTVIGISLSNILSLLETGAVEEPTVEVVTPKKRTRKV
jgi:hypothetical protein